MRLDKILSREEVVTVLADLHQRTGRAKGRNLIVFRLSCCCGLRCKEICGLDMADVMTAGDRPAVRVRKAITKGQESQRRGRVVPLWWDGGTLADLRSWKQYRLDMGAGPTDPFVCQANGARAGMRTTRKGTTYSWTTAIRALGPERARQLSIHTGRHSFCSHALDAGRSLAEVRDAAGHRNIQTTSIYLHVLERGGVPDIFIPRTALPAIICPKCGHSFIQEPGNGRSH